MPRPNLVEQFAVGGRNDPRIDGHGVRRAQPSNFFFLKHSQELALELSRQFTNFIQK